MKKLKILLFVTLFLSVLSIGVTGVQAAASSITLTEWLNTGADRGQNFMGPRSKKVWQVRYRSGIKYEGYMYWTGKYKVNISDPRPNFNQFQYKGTLYKK